MRIHSGFVVALTLLALSMLTACGNKGPLVMPDKKPPITQPPAPASQQGANGGRAPAVGAKRFTDASRGTLAKASP